MVLQNRAGNCYDYNKGNYASLREMMDIDWLALLQPLNGDPDAWFQLLSKTLEKAVKLCVPCYKKKKYNRAPIDRGV